MLSLTYFKLETILTNCLETELKFLLLPLLTEVPHYWFDLILVKSGHFPQQLISGMVCDTETVAN